MAISWFSQNICNIYSFGTPHVILHLLHRVIGINHQKLTSNPQNTHEYKHNYKHECAGLSNNWVEKKRKREGQKDYSAHRWMILLAMEERCFFSILVCCFTCSYPENWNGVELSWQLLFLVSNFFESFLNRWFHWSQVA